MSEAIHRTNPPINAMDFGVPPLFAERAENYARWAVASEREACAKLIEPSEEHRRDASWGYIGGEEGVELLDAMAAAIRARSKE